MTVDGEENMRVEQFVMAYGVEQDRLRALLPAGFASLRPVLRINAEIRDGAVPRRTGTGAGSTSASGRTCPLCGRGKR